jgi:hypothetical protein
MSPTVGPAAGFSKNLDDAHRLFYTADIVGSARWSNHLCCVLQPAHLGILDICRLAYVEERHGRYEKRPRVGDGKN